MLGSDMSVCVCVCVRYIYIYIYRERERERKREIVCVRERESGCVCVLALSSSKHSWQRINSIIISIWQISIQSISWVFRCNNHIITSLQKLLQYVPLQQNELAKFNLVGNKYSPPPTPTHPTSKEINSLKCTGMP